MRSLRGSFGSAEPSYRNRFKMKEQAEKYSTYSTTFYMVGMLLLIIFHFDFVKNGLELIMSPAIFLFLTLGSYYSSYALKPFKEVPDMNVDLFWLFLFVFLLNVVISTNTFFNIVPL
jgi:hypothetical protein